MGRIALFGLSEEILDYSGSHTTSELDGRT